jgi:UDP-N-acetyl-D-glucosamine dehydrogenase
MSAATIETLRTAIAARSAHIGIVGLGYVGLPLALAFHGAGFRVTGFDIDADKARKLNAGISYISHIAAETVARMVASGRFRATDDFSAARQADALLICVPTPLTRHREPDLSFVERTTGTLAAQARPGQLFVLESTTWPGTTAEVVKPILERSGLAVGRDIFLAFSPEREDPGNRRYSTSTIPKIVGADDAASAELAAALYGASVANVVPVSSARTAEAVKLTENIFRSVNIALVNELKVVYRAMGIDVWEVIDAAATKPFGFMPFYPGPGLGGHCIPIDPFYLSWKAREFEVPTRFVELAGEINTAMPHWVAERVAEALDTRAGRGLKGARILILGVAYKKSVDDMRESPALKLIELLEARGAECLFHDPYVPAIPPTREHAALTGRRSSAFDAAALEQADCVLIATDHDGVDYELLKNHARLVIDTRNVLARLGLEAEHFLKA